MAKNANDVVLTHYARTAFDKFGGILADWHSSDLASAVIAELIKRSGLKPELIQEAQYGSCLASEIGLKKNIPIRQALLKGGLTSSTISTTYDRACCSSTTAMQVAWKRLRAGICDVSMVIGADNFQNMPLVFDPKFRWDPIFRGNLTLKDQLTAVGYEDWGRVAVDAGEVALEHNVSREMQDMWSVRSHDTWGIAFEKGYFKEEIFPLEIQQGKKPPIIFNTDQSPRPGTSFEVLSKLPLVPGSPTITGGNAPGLNSGASGVILMTRKRAEELGCEPVGKILNVASVADNYRYIATVPGAAILISAEMAGIKATDIEVIEINEAFAAMPLVSTKIMSKGDDGLWKHYQDITNINGGAVAIGHPVGATGTRLVMTTLRELKRRGAKYGAAAICGGLAQGDAVLVEAE